MPPKAAVKIVPDILPESYALRRDDHGTVALQFGVETLATCHYYNMGTWAVTEPDQEPRLFDNATDARNHFWGIYVAHSGDGAAKDAGE